MARAAAPGARGRCGRPSARSARCSRARALRRLQLAWVGSILGGWAYLVALGVYAYEQGGASAVGLVGLIRLVPAAIVAPFSATLVDRFSRVSVMIVSDLVRFALMIGAAAVIATDGPPPVVYGLVALSTDRGHGLPAGAGGAPAVARRVAGRADGGERRLEHARERRHVPRPGARRPPARGERPGGRVRRERRDVPLVGDPRRRAPRCASSRASGQARAAGGPRRVAGHARRDHDDRAEPNLRTLVGLYAAQTLVAGALNVLVVVTAFELLDLDEAGVGLLYAAVGVGGLVGGFVALVLSARGRLARDFALGLALFGLPLAVVGGLPFAVVAVVALGVLGIGNSIVDVNALTIMQRAVPTPSSAARSAPSKGCCSATLGLGALVAPVLIELVGPEAALVVTGRGAAGPRAPDAAAAARDRPDVERARGDRAAARRAAARGAARAGARAARARGDPVEFRAGVPIVREGEPGDRFYVVRSGGVSILGRTFGPGEAFGEIALLRDVPRTATAVAVTDVELVALERRSVRRGGDRARAERGGGRHRDRGAARVAQRRDCRV